MCWHMHGKNPGRERSQNLPKSLSELAFRARSLSPWPTSMHGFLTVTVITVFSQYLFPSFRVSTKTLKTLPLLTSATCKWTLSIVSQSARPTAPAEWWVQGWVCAPFWANEMWDVCSGFMGERLSLTLTRPTRGSLLSAWTVWHLEQLYPFHSEKGVPGAAGGHAGRQRTGTERSQVLVAWFEPMDQALQTTTWSVSPLFSYINQKLPSCISEFTSSCLLLVALKYLIQYFCNNK